MKNPDIEIYVKDANGEIISEWLQDFFDSINMPKLNNQSFSKGHTIQGTVSTVLGDKIPVMITPHASGKAFCSIWFKSDKTAWDNDEACALSFLQKNNTEVRCSAGSWAEDEDLESEQWLSLTPNEKKLIPWG